MKKVNAQVRLPAEIEAEISKTTTRSRSAFVREAIVEKLARERVRRLEEQWIRSLQGHPERSEEAEGWLKLEAWEK